MAHRRFGITERKRWVDRLEALEHCTDRRAAQSYGIMQPGHIFTIEPMLNVGKEWRDLSWPDDWTVSTIDGARSAAAEETLLITETGVEILTAQGGPKHIDTRHARSAYFGTTSSA